MAQSMTKPLPDGWEKRTTPSGQAYFIDHKSRKSAWVAPPGCDIGVLFFSLSCLFDLVLSLMTYSEQDSPGYSFSFLLHTVSINNLMTCPNELCKKRNPIYRTLLNIPKAVSIGLTWGRFEGLHISLSPLSFDEANHNNPINISNIQRQRENGPDRGAHEAGAVVRGPEEHVQRVRHRD